MEPQAIMAYAIPRTSFSSKKCWSWSSLPLPILFSTILYSPRQPVVCGRSSLESCVWPLHHNHWDHSLTDWLIYWLTYWLIDLLTEISLRGPGRQAGRQGAQPVMTKLAKLLLALQRENLSGQKTCIQLNLDLEIGRDLKGWWKYKYNIN